MLGQAKSRPAPFPRAPRGHYDIWLVGFARKTDTHADTTPGAQEERGGGRQGKEGPGPNDTAAKPVPAKPGPTRPAPRAAQCACQQPREPSLQTARKGGRAGGRVTAALPAAGGKGPSPGGSSRPLRPGGGARRPPACRFPLSATTHQPGLPEGAARRPSAAPPPAAGAGAPSRPPAQMPPPRGLTLTKAGGAAAFSSRRAPWAPSCRGGGGASETQTRVCSKSRAQRHSTAASHNTLGPPRPRAPLRPPRHSSRPASPLPPFPRPFRGAGPAPWQPEPRHSAGAVRTLLSHVTPRGALCQSFRTECSIRPGREGWSGTAPGAGRACPIQHPG